MSDDIENANPDKGDELPPVPPWVRARAEDIADLDFEAPLNGATTADCNELRDLYQAALTPSDGSAEPPDTPAVRTFVMLSA